MTADRRLLAGALGVLLGVLSTACASSASPSATSGGPRRAAASLHWLCRPGQVPDPCTSTSLDVSAVTGAGAVARARWPHSPIASKFACFYVLPTTSLARTANAGVAVTKLEAFIGAEQASPLSRVCEVWAPVYRSQTFTSVQQGLAGDESLMRSTFTVAYDSVLPAWRWFLAHTEGKPIVLVGDSQGAAILIHLISTRLDREPSLLRRLLVAILVGGNLQVPSGKTVGATFTRVPLCTSRTQTGCAIAFSSYPAQPPPDSVFGRPGQGTSLQSGQTVRVGQQVACVNPAALRGGSGDLDPYLLTSLQVGLGPRVSTPWVTYPHLYSAACRQGGGAAWLQITSRAGTSHARPVVNDAVVGHLGGGTGPAWGYHAYEYGLTLGNLLRDVAGEEAAWESRR